MARHARKKAESGIYHIMLRGINRQQIFIDDEDRQRFLKTLEKYKEQCGYEIYAFCLMPNHIHLLLKEGKENLTLVFKRIAGSFVYWYNWKYNRCGHLFQDRFKSEPVEDDSYLITVVRYIHQNPVKAKLCQNAEAYLFSSMNAYLSGSTLVDTDFVLSILPQDEFLEFHKTENDDECLEIEENRRLTDREAAELIYKRTQCKFPAQLESLNTRNRNQIIKELYNKGVSIRQMSRLTGWTKAIIEYNIK